jgi:iron complex transport system substrate-binding protein
MVGRRLVLLAALSVALSCSKGKSAPATAKRIASLSPSTTEAVFAIGAGAALVGRSRYCDYPPEVLALPQVGGYVDPSFEAILALQPDLVVGARGPAGSAIADRLTARGIATYFPETESLARVREMLEGLGQRTAHEAGARAAIASIDDQARRVGRALEGAPKKRVLLVFGLAPISVAGPGGFPDEMLRLAGGLNVVTEGGPYPTLGIETVLRLDPDVVLNAAMMEPRAAERIGKDVPGWERLRAVQTGHVVAITDEAVLRPGPRIGAGLAVLARAIHPEAAR